MIGHYITESEKAYAAGIIDGEGCIQIAINHYNRGLSKQHFIQVSVHMTDIEVLQFLHNRWGGWLGKRSRKSKCIKPHYKDSYDWRVQSNKAKKILVDIIPYLIGKKNQALLAMQLKLNPRKVGRGNKLTHFVLSERDLLKRKLMDLKRPIHLRVFRDKEVA